MLKNLKQIIHNWASSSQPNVESQLAKLNDYIVECSHKHTMHERKEQQHEELLRTIIDTQKTMSDTQNNMSKSLTVFSNFVEKHEPNFDIVDKVILALGGVKAAVGWLAAVIAGLGIIIGGLLATWVYLSSSISLSELIDKL